jgi:hypothetical protein
VFLFFGKKQDVKSKSGKMNAVVFNSGVSVLSFSSKFEILKPFSRRTTRWKDRKKILTWRQNRGTGRACAGYRMFRPGLLSRQVLKLDQYKLYLP